MKTDIDLIRQLENEAGNFTGVALVVGFENSTVFIFASDADRLEKLSAALSVGGEPVGFIGYDMHNGLLTVQQRALDEYAQDEWVSDYLSSLTSQFKRVLYDCFPNHVRPLSMGGTA